MEKTQIQKPAFLKGALHVISIAAALSMAHPYRNILSLDGGGSWALIQAMALDKLYPGESGRQVLQRFDLAIANSGGSLVLGALASDMAPAQIVTDMFLDEGRRRSIFVDTILDPFTHAVGIGPRYKAEAKLPGLRNALNRDGKHFGDVALEKLGDGIPGLPDIVITSFDYDRQRSVFFRSNKASKAGSGPSPAGPSLAEALHASSNAPVNYFNAPALFQTQGYAGKRYWDGGTAGLNNPVLAGVVEAIANGSDPAALNLLSIGTASVMLPLQDGTIKPELAIRPAASNLFHDIGKLARTILDDPPDAASYIAFRILHRDNDNPGIPRLVRLNPLVQPVRPVDSGTDWRYPDTLDQPYPDASDPSAFEQLVKLDMDAVEQNQVKLIQRFCSLWLQDKVPNQPIQSGADLSCHIGQRWFSLGDAARRKIGL